MRINKQHFTNFNVGESILRGIEEAREYEKGNKSKARSVFIEIPTPVYKAKDVVRVREKCHLTQNGLALALCVSRRTVEAWETGKNKPAGPSTRLLYLLENDASVLKKLIIIK
jgi:putative transcriptional regulator